jgi:hypothetical protein
VRDVERIQATSRAMASSYTPMAPRTAVWALRFERERNLMGPSARWGVSYWTLDIVRDC